MKQLIYYIAAVMLSLCVFAMEGNAENRISQGRAIVILSVKGDGTFSADSLVGEVYRKTLLDSSNDGSFRPMQPTYVVSGRAEVPMETLYCNGVGMTICDSRGNAITSMEIGLHQEEPLDITLIFDRENNIVGVEHSGGTGKVDLTGQNSRIRMNYGSTDITCKEDWEDSERYLQWQLTNMYPKNLKEALEGEPLNEGERLEIEKSLTRDYFVLHILPYVRRAKTWGKDFVGVNPDSIVQPPLSFYRFLNDCDLSADMLNDYTGNMHLICRNILYDLPVGIGPIGDTPIDQWQEDVRTRLTQVLDNPSQMLLDLLTATSYFDQIQYRGISLTQRQKGNIKQFYQSSDLGKIILLRNDMISTKC